MANSLPVLVEQLVVAKARVKELLDQIGVLENNSQPIDDKLLQIQKIHAELIKITRDVDQIKREIMLYSNQQLN